MNNKKGEITQYFTLLMSFAILIVTVVYIINMLIPFIWYQKLQNIADKYIYVVERFGYLTSGEQEQLYKDLVSEGFDINNILLECPDKKLEYGERFDFNITYRLNLKNSILEGIIKHETKEILLHVKKYGYSKN